MKTKNALFLIATGLLVSNAGYSSCEALIEGLKAEENISSYEEINKRQEKAIVKCLAESGKEEVEKEYVTKFVTDDYMSSLRTQVLNHQATGAIKAKADEVSVLSTKTFTLDEINKALLNHTTYRPIVMKEFEMDEVTRYREFRNGSYVYKQGFDVACHIAENHGGDENKDACDSEQLSDPHAICKMLDHDIATDVVLSESIKQPSKESGNFYKINFTSGEKSHFDPDTLSYVTTGNKSEPKPQKVEKKEGYAVRMLEGISCAKVNQDQEDKLRKVIETQMVIADKANEAVAAKDEDEGSKEPKESFSSFADRIRKQQREAEEAQRVETREVQLQPTSTRHNW